MGLKLWTKSGPIEIDENGFISAIENSQRNQKNGLNALTNRVILCTPTELQSSIYNTHWAQLELVFLSQM